ncbi:hypothetical protein MMC22_010598 [Lobaria immixta]|nr:hypothetical protein [Lobaria immixta]
MAPAAAKQPKKKNAPDKPMPEWMFPDDDKNPVLNAKEKSEEQILKEKKEWDQAVDFLQHKSVSAPLKPPPPALLLTLVGAFLTSYGFNSASRIYTTQLSSRKKLDDWKFELGEKLPKGFPDLVKIFKEWYKEYQERVHLDETSSENDDDDNDAPNPKSIKKEKKKTQKKAAVAKDSSGSSSAGSNSSSTSAGSDSSSDESEADVKSESASPAPKAVKRKSKSASPSNFSSSSSSDSDADDEQEVVQKPRSASSSSSSDETSSSSDSDSSPHPPHIPKTDNKPPNVSTKSSSSSATLEITSPQKPATASGSKTSSSVSSSDSSSETSSSSSDSPAQPHDAGVPVSPSKRKRSASPPAPQPAAKKHRTPFQRVPKDTKVDAKLASNAYVSHEYGDRAHQDLSVTRGKGFTKEKNKKKRGSYRGGAIDVGGGKGIKFED